MPVPEWKDEINSGAVERNLKRLATEIAVSSRTTRAEPTPDLAIRWHREMLEGADVPDESYRGGIRGANHPALADHNVVVGGLPTTPAHEVPDRLSGLFSSFKKEIETLDRVDADLGDELSAQFVESVLLVAAWVHAEWIKIHPFVNGNGRTARMWVLWICARYGLPNLLPLRPCPDWPYESASRLAMVGDNSLFVQFLLMRYNQAAE